MSCERTRRVAPELALGTADGWERAEALRHLASCPACRRELEELSGLSDELLMLAPEREPPIGFESRLFERLALRSPHHRSRRPVAAAIAAAIAAAALTAVGMLVAFDDERDLAASYRESLARADGQYFETAHLYQPGEAPAGTVFGYQGDPSWIVVVVERQARVAGYEGELVTMEGRRVALPFFRLDPASGSWGGAIPIDLREVSEVRLLGPGRREVLEAELPVMP